MIYLLEDDDSIRDLVIYTLQSQGMEAKGFPRPSAFWEAMAEHTPSLVLLDIMLPEEDGLQILKKLRQNPATRRTPVIMLTAKGSEYDKVIGLEAGADDYIPKPFGMMELIARVRALLRRAAPQRETTLHCGAVSLDPVCHIVTVQGAQVELTRKEFDLLRLLMSYPQQVFTRDSLLSKVWGYEFDGESRTVDVHIRSLRQKLGAAASCIETVRGVGYRMGGAG